MKKLSVLMLLLICGISTSFAQSKDNANQSVIAVMGKGVVHIEPDYVVIKLGVNSKAAEALQAKEENDKIISQVLKFVQSFNIEAKDVQTQRIDLYKQKDYESKEEFYMANQTINVTLRSLSSYEDFMIGVMKLGINSIQGIEFSSSKADQYSAKARALAVADAKEKAGDYASALGQKMGKAVAVKDSSVTVNAPSPIMMRYAKADASGGQQTLAQGEIEVSAEVYIEFTLN